MKNFFIKKYIFQHIFYLHDSIWLFILLQSSKTEMQLIFLQVFEIVYIFRLNY